MYHSGEASAHIFFVECKKCLFEKLEFWMQWPSGMWRHVFYQTDYKLREKSLACIFIRRRTVQFLLKGWHISAKLYGVIREKTAIFIFTSVRTSYFVQMLLHIRIVWSEFHYTDDMNSVQNHTNMTAGLATQSRGKIFVTCPLSEAVEINKPLLIAIKNYHTIYELLKWALD